MVDTIVTQEPTIEIEAHEGENDTQELVDDTAITQELAVGAKANQREKETVT